MKPGIVMARAMSVWQIREGVLPGGRSASSSRMLISSSQTVDQNSMACNATTSSPSGAEMAAIVACNNIQMAQCFGLLVRFEMKEGVRERREAAWYLVDGNNVARQLVVVVVGNDHQALVCNAADFDVRIGGSVENLSHDVITLSLHTPIDTVSFERGRTRNAKQHTSVLKFARTKRSEFNKATMATRLRSPTSAMPEMMAVKMLLARFSGIACGL